MAALWWSGLLLNDAIWSLQPWSFWPLLVHQGSLQLWTIFRSKPKKLFLTVFDCVTVIKLQKTLHPILSKNGICLEKSVMSPEWPAWWHTESWPSLRRRFFFPWHGRPAPKANITAVTLMVRFQYVINHNKRNMNNGLVWILFLFNKVPWFRIV